jgi:alkylation response protein AidB-like acyl-CoA dehydrogenase
VTLGPSEYEALRELGASFARRELSNDRETHDRHPITPLWDGVLRRASDLGFFAMTLGERHGGSGAGTTALVPLCEEISRVDASLAGAIFANAAAIEVVNVAAESSDCTPALESISTAGALPLAFAACSSPVESVLPSERPAGPTVAITGSARNVFLGGVARYAVIAVGGDAGRSYVFVDLHAPGVHASQPVPCIGFRACPMVDLSFDGAVAFSIGAAGGGLELFRRMAERLAPAAAAISLGIMKGCFDEAHAYAQERRQGGRRILDWPAVAAMLGEMSVDILLGETCLLAAAQGGAETDASALAVRLGEWACRATTDGVQVLGGYGYMSDYGQEKRMRDARMARQLLGMPALRRQDWFGRRWGPSRQPTGSRKGACG